MKRVIVAIVSLLVVFSCAFAANNINIQWKYKINKFVAESYSFVFVDYSGEPITRYSVDTGKGISSPQIQLKVITNKVRSYSVDISFGPMRLVQGNSYDPTFFGSYQARVSGLFQETNSDPAFKNAFVTTSESQVLTIPGETSNNANNTLTAYYPIAFSFQDYIEDYPVGSFEAAVTVEISGT